MSQFTMSLQFFPGLVCFIAEYFTCKISMRLSHWRLLLYS